MKPSEVIFNFSLEMNKWENYCLESDTLNDQGLITIEEHRSTCKSKYQEIFNKYCDTNSAEPRDFFFATPPDYNPNQETLSYEKISDSKAILAIQQNHKFKILHRYYLNLVANEWKIHKREIICDDGEVLRAQL